MSLRIKLKEIDEIDLNQYCLLQQKSFAAVFEKNQIDIRYLDPLYFSWKYNTPAGKARIAYVEESSSIIASVAMYPIYIVVKGVKVKSWHFVEAAVLPEARRKGLFQRCMDRLIESLAAGEIIYVFPNTSSITGTIKAGFQIVEHSKFYARFFFNLFKSEINLIEADQLFSNEQDSYADAISSLHKVMVFRDAAYMNWRYKQHPYFSYHTFAPLANGRIMGNVVARAVFIKGMKLLLIMEMHSITKGAQKEINSFLRSVAAKENCLAAGMFSGQCLKPTLFATGMVPVPAFVVPKQHILMSYQNKDAYRLKNVDWLFQTGDWDAF